MTELQRQMSFEGISTLEGMHQAITQGLAQRLRVPLDQFRTKSSQFDKIELAKVVFDACAGVSAIEDEGKSGIALCYRRLESWAITIFKDEVQPLIQSQYNLDSLEPLKVPAIQVLEGGIYYVRKFLDQEVPALREQVLATKGAMYFCYQKVDILTTFEIEAIGEAIIPGTELLNAAIFYIGDSKKGTAKLFDVSQALTLFELLGSSQKIA